ncbi:PAS domain S-box protein [Flavobacterium sp. N3904]|uniref:PAS domain S-box protein n=1 Tax=Flavobacterium sp. N3904 TaxID=2986835 RepID=UPI0022256295|nr:PAS domain S-box protein [Flavobacterium sp. N3904]
MKETIPSIEELLQKLKKQEQKISILQKKIDSIANFEFFTKETSDFICVSDLNSFLKEFNIVFLKKSGYSKRELLINSYLKFIHPEDVAKTANALQELLEDKTSVIFENRILTKKGENIYVQWTSIINPSNNLVYSLGRDITEIRMIQEKLTASENLLNDAQQLAKIGSWELNLLTNSLIWTKELYHIFEIPEMPTDNLYKQYFEHFSEEDREMLNNLIAESMRSKRPYEITHKVLLSNNRFKWVYGTGIPILNEKGEIIALRGIAQDITEKKQIESEILAKEKEVATIKEKKREQESNAKFRNYVKNAPDGVFVANEKGLFLEVNSAATKIMGYSQKKLLSMSINDIIHPNSLEKIKLCFETLFLNGTSNDIVAYIHKNGEIRYCSIDAVKLSEKQVLLFVKDITENIEAVQALKEKEKRFRVLVENAPEALVVIDFEQQKFVSVSQSALVLFKMTEEELLNLGPVNLSPEYQPNGQLSAALADEKFKEAIAGGKPSFEWTHIDSQGNSIFCDVRLVRLPPDNKVLIRASIIDITDRKKAEEHLKENELFLKETQRIAQLGTYSMDMSTGKWTRTEILNDIFGIDQNFDLNGQSWFEIVHPMWRETMRDYVLNEVIQKRVQFDKEYKIIRIKDQAERWVHGMGTLKLDENDQPSVIVGAIRDITDTKIMELELIRAKEIAEENEKDLLFKYIEYEEINEKLKQTNKELVKAKTQADEANKAKSEFLSNMSHEIRTPLNGIVGFTDLLMKTNLEKNQLEYMSTVNVSANTLMEIINDILDFSKIESGKLELFKEETDLFRLLHQVIDLFKHQANLKNIDLSLNIEENVPQYILADAIRLKQILVNLISNALKFTSFGHIRLDVEQTKLGKKNNATIKFSIKDSGIGIKQYNQKKIFDSFVQEDNATSRKFGGTGLGLAISNLLLELMKSNLQLKSKYGDGSDFFFSIKFKKVEPIKDTFRELAHPTVIRKVKTVKNINVLRVLIVEDNKINMFLAKTLVKRIIPNVIILEASDGQEGIEQFELNKPDLVLMDIQMPIKNGYEATVEIRKLKKGKNTPIIALTAGIMVGEKDKCIEYGMNDYISKPIIEDDLENVIHKWIPEEVK